MKAAIAAALVVVAACAGPEARRDSPAAAAVKPVEAASLVGTRWRGAVEPGVEARFAPWLEFVSDGRVSGYTGCNLLHGAWKIEGGIVHLGPIVTTKRACVGPESEVERRVLAGFGEFSRVAREGDKLVLTARGGERVEFVEVR